MPNVENGIFRSIEYHSWPSPAHHVPHLLAHLLGIAVNGTLLARLLVLPKPTMVKTLTRIVGQRLIRCRHHVQPQVVAAIKGHHLADCLLLPLYLGHRYLIKCMGCHASRSG